MRLEPSDDLASWGESERRRFVRINTRGAARHRMATATNPREHRRKGVGVSDADGTQAGMRSEDSDATPRAYFFAACFVNVITCCHGSLSEVLACFSSLNSAISFSTCFSVILWTSLIGTFSSSRRNSTNTIRPPGLSAFTIFLVISYGNENSW